MIAVKPSKKDDKKKYVGDAMPNAMNKAWDTLKALPHQQAFRVFPKRGGPQHFGGKEHTSTNPKFTHRAVDVGSMDVPDTQEHERLGTVNPAITAMLERQSSSTPYSRGKHSFPLTESKWDQRGKWDTRMSHQVDDIEGLTEPPPKTTHGYQDHFLESVPDTRHYSPTSGGTGSMHRRREEAEQRNRDISANDPDYDDNEDLEWNWGKNQDLSDAGWESRRKLTPKGQEIVTQGSLFGEPDAPEPNYDYEPDYSELSHDEIYGEEPVGVRDDRFDLGLYNEKTGKFALEGQKNNLFNKAWAVLKQNKCENCGKETRHLYTNPMQAGQRNTVPSVCRDCVSNIELSDAFYGYYN